MKENFLQQDSQIRVIRKTEEPKQPLLKFTLSHESSKEEKYGIKSESEIEAFRVKG